MSRKGVTKKTSYSARKARLSTSQLVGEMATQGIEATCNRRTASQQQKEGPGPSLYRTAINHQHLVIVQRKCSRLRSIERCNSSAACTEELPQKKIPLGLILRSPRQNPIFCGVISTHFPSPPHAQKNVGSKCILSKTNPSPLQALDRREKLQGVAHQDRDAVQSHRKRPYRVSLGDVHRDKRLHRHR